MRRFPAQILLLLALPLLSSVSSAQSWIQRPGTDHWYAVTPGPDSWDNLQAQAVEWGGNLASFENLSENEWAATVISVETAIGLKEASEGEWYWVDGTPLSFTNWDDGEPNNGGGGGGESRAVIGYSLTHGGSSSPSLWHDYGGDGRPGLIEVISTDCNGNDLPDVYELAIGASDVNGNGIIDECELNWTQRPGSGHWYAASFAPMTWDQHQVNAESLGGNLVIIEEQAENDWITSQLSPDPFWFIGLYQDVSDPSYSEPEGGWKWADGHIPSYTNWAANEPNNLDGGGEQHAAIRASGEWADIPNNPGAIGTPEAAIYECVSEDCDGNGLPDIYEFAGNGDRDANGNGIIDDCEVVLPGLSGWTRRVGSDDWYIQTSGFNWSYGRTLAQNAGADLAVIESQEELDWCISYAQSSEVFIGLFQDHSATDFSEPAGGWRWVDLDNSFLEWAPTEPNDGRGPENHGVLASSGIHDGDGDRALPCLFKINSTDCDSNGVPDTYEIRRDPSLDLNLDGVLDLCSWSEKILITTTAGNAREVYACDLDGDGDIDVLSASYGDIAWYENHDGSFSQGVTNIITTATAEAWSVHAADLDNDGDPDVLSASRDDNKVAWYENRLNEASGDFGGQIILNGPNSSETSAQGAIHVFAADLDNDGNLDVLSASDGDGKIAWYRNGGNGTFEPQVSFDSGRLGGPRSIIAADLDGDNDLDVLSAWNGDNAIAWNENQGGGAFSPINIITTAADGANNVDAADLDNDGDLDVLSTSAAPTDRVSWYENIGAGQFSSMIEISTTENGASDVIAFDGDGDSDNDVFSICYNDGEINWYQNLGNGTPSPVFTSALLIADSIGGGTSIYSADLNNDSNLDLISASDNGEIAWYKNLAPVDCNGNGIPDSEDILAGISLDCDTNGVPDECEFIDCDFDGVGDHCEIANGTELDCNGNGVPDWCDVTYATSEDCNSDGVPDECQSQDDCNSDGIKDLCQDLLDCNGDGIPDDCDPDCNGDGISDICCLLDGACEDCDSNGVPDICDYTDCDLDGIGDHCEIANGTELDCNGNGVPDWCDVTYATSEDCNSDGVPDECQSQEDCNADGIKDLCQDLPDCNDDGIPDICQEFDDCNDNGVPDECDISPDGLSHDVNENGIPDECECFASWYCGTTPNSAGPGVLINYEGSLSVELNDLKLTASGGIAGQPGLFYYGSTQLNGGNGVVFGNGLRCVGGNPYTFRVGGPTFMNSAGNTSKSIDLTSGPMGSGPGEIHSGDTFNFQLWYRDPEAGPFTFNLSDAMQLTFCP